MSIQITSAAQAHVCRTVGEPRTVRLALKPSGCAGYSYVFSETPALGDDLVLDFPGFQLAVAAQDVAKMSELVIDCESGLGGTRMVFRNPHETARCGCGRSVELKEQSA